MTEILKPRNWDSVYNSYKSSEPFDHVVMDDFLAEDLCKSLRHKLLDHWGWYYKKPTAEELYLREPDFIELETIAKYLLRALPSLFGDFVMVQSWAFLHHRNSGLKLHSDNGRLTLNLWLTPDEYNLTNEGGGLILTDVKRTDKMQIHEFASPPWAPAFIEQQTQGKRVRIPYRYNRAVLFDARIFHGSDNFCFDISSTDRARLNLSLLFDRSEDYRARLIPYN